MKAHYCEPALAARSQRCRCWFRGCGFAANEHAVLPQLKTITTIASTVPGNGDESLWRGPGAAHRGQPACRPHPGQQFQQLRQPAGTGTTIVDVAPDGTMSVFAALNAGDTARRLPGRHGAHHRARRPRSGLGDRRKSADRGRQHRHVRGRVPDRLDSLGKAVETFYGSLINGPWDMTAFEGEHEAKLFVTNVLNGTVAANGTSSTAAP